MLQTPPQVQADFEVKVEAHRIDHDARFKYRQWLRYYFDMCGKHGHPSDERETLPVFMRKLASKGQDDAKRAQAMQAILLYYELVDSGKGHCVSPVADRAQPAPRPSANRPVAKSSGKAAARTSTPSHTRAAKPDQGSPVVRQAPARAEGLPLPDGVPGVQVVREPTDRAGPLPSTGVSWVAQYTALSDAIQLRHYSPTTLKTYTNWIRKFQTFTRSKDPAMIDAEDVKAFLTNLAVQQNVSASTQNQAFNALLFFFRHALGREFGKIDGVVRAKRTRYIPVVLSRAEIDAVIGVLLPPFDLVVKLLYGCGLRISECLALRVHCFNLDAGILTVHDGKGQKDRTVPLPETILPEIRAQLSALHQLHAEDLAAGYSGVFLPKQFEKKSKHAATDFIWQWFFPARQLTRVSGTAELRRYHEYSNQVSQAVKHAAEAAAITKRVTPHTFRHSFASHLLQANYDICTIQKLLGHSDVKTTMIYTQTVPSKTLKDAKSPLDL